MRADTVLFSADKREMSKMRVLVAVKRVIDYGAPVRVKSALKQVEKANVKMSMNPFCEIAIEQAVQLKEKQGAEVVAVTIGEKKASDQLVRALAMGADRAIHFKTDMATDFDVQPLAVAKVLAWLADREKPDLIITGKQSIDDDSNQTGQMVAGLLDLPQASFASEVVVAEDLKSMQVTREVDGGLRSINVKLPAVVTADLRLNTPRYATLPNMMKARKKKIEEIDMDSLGLDLAPRITVEALDDPPVRAAGVMVESVDQLLDKLKNEAGVV